MNTVVRRNTDDILIVSSMMDLAQGKAVGNNRITSGLTVGNDVSSVEKFRMMQPADCPDCPEEQIPAILQCTSPA